MNIDTGEIHEFPKGLNDPDLKARLERGERLVSLAQNAKPSCRYCYGRGYEFVAPNGVHVPCRCTKKGG